MNAKIKNSICKVLKEAVVVIIVLFITSSSYSQPQEMWVSKFNGFDYDDKPRAMAIDNEGNVYVTGYSIGKDSGRDFFTIKYSPDGKVLWSARYEGFENIDGNDDEANSIVVDREGNAYVTGFSHSGVRGRDFCTVKYNTKGTQLWVVYFSGLGGIEDSDDEAVSIALDNSGYVIVAGSSNGLATGYDLCAVKYNPDGHPLWIGTFDGEVGLDDKAISVKSDQGNNVLVAGYSESMRTGRDLCLVKFNSAGVLLWTAKYNGLEGDITSNDDEASSLALDADNNIFVSGYSYGERLRKDFLTVKYSPEGKQEWASRFDNIPTEKNTEFDGEAKAIAIDAFGNVYVTGKTSYDLNGSDLLTIKLSANGQIEWWKIYDSEMYPGSEDAAEAIALDKRGNVYVTGYINGGEALLEFCGNERGKDFFTIKYSPSGVKFWSKDFNGSGLIGRNDDVAKAIIIDAKGRIYVAGETMGEDTELDYCLIRYSESILSDESTSSGDQNFKLNDNYPNPFNPSTKISFEIPTSSETRLSIYDISGRQVALLVNEVLQAGIYEYEWNATQFASGTYFYKIQTNDFTQTKKMFLIK